MKIGVVIAFALAFAGLALLVYTVERAPPVLDHEAFAWAGQRVTREDGTLICTLTRDLHRDAAASAEGWCDGWTIERPVKGAAIPGDGSRWIRVSEKGLQLHVEGRWVP